jgi:hypothetical protein
MAKRHHGLPKHAQAHLSEHKMEGHYEDHAHRRAMEAADGAMVPSGAGKFANMPSEVVHIAYPDAHSFLPEHLDDSIRGIDHQIDADNSKKMAKLQPKKV